MKILKKAIYFGIVLFCISVIGFLIIELAPGDAMSMYGIREYSGDSYQRLQARLGLDKNVFMRYIDWLLAFLKGDWGISQSQHEPVVGLLLDRMKNSIFLMSFALVISLVVAIPLGLISGMSEGSKADSFISMISYCGISIPQYWLAILLVIIFSLKLGLLPSTGMRTFGEESVSDLCKHMLLPCISIGFPNMCIYIRYIRSSTIEQIGTEYVLTAVSKGCSLKRVLFSHVLKNCMLPTITLIAMNFTSLITGSFIVETVFGWPGMGGLGMSAASCRDYPLIMGFVMMTGVIVVMGNFIADILYSVIDPRIKQRER